MSKEVVIGKSGGDKFRMNVDALIRGRLLVQANSGGGKTHLMRRILETTFGAVQHIVLDIEGEFSTLRKKFDYVLIGEDGDGISSEYQANSGGFNNAISQLSTLGLIERSNGMIRFNRSLM